MFKKTLTGALLFVAVSAPAQSFLGDWLQNCNVINDDDYTKNLVLIDKENFDHVVFAYEDSGCQKAYLILKKKFKVKKLNEFENTLEASVEKVTYTPLSEEIAQALNLISYCGITDWKDVQEKIVTGKKCQDFLVPEKGKIENYQFKVNSQKQLFMNKDLNPFNKLMK